MKNALLRVISLTGEKQNFLLDPNKSPYTIGRHPDCQIRLSESETPLKALRLSYFPLHNADQSQGQWWIETLDHPLELEGSAVIQSQWSEGHLLTIGGTELTLLSSIREDVMPQWPRSVREWMTKSSTGRSLLLQLYRAAQNDLPIALQGDTGTGKDLLAQAVHGWSRQAGGPFVPINCGAIAPELAESEFFGHVKGAFTNAHQHRVGALLQAHQGTLFLDEVADLRLDLQVKLLRFLENGEVRPVGSDQVRHSKVRVICASHTPLMDLVRQGKFRQDLYYRLASLTLKVPSLQERPEDIRHLAQTWAREHQKVFGPHAMRKLLSYSWPGNVRQLRFVVENACGLAGSDRSIIGPQDLNLFEDPHSPPEPEKGSLLTLKEMEKIMLIRALKLCQGHRGKAAEILGIGRSTLFEMIKRYDLKVPRNEIGETLALRTVS